MKKHAAGLFLLFSCFIVVLGGCAQNNTVMKEEPVAPSSGRSTLAKAESANVAQPGDQSAKQTPVRKSAADTPARTQDAGSLNAALEKIYFDFDSYNLSPEARTSLQKNMELLKKRSAAVVRIEGHCDERGSAEYNLALGEKRAASARNYLVTLGIPENRFSVISYGKERPAVRGNTESVWAKNRRDEFVIQ